MPQHILLLEDEQAIADPLLYVLRSEGFEVTHALLASAALSSFLRRPPDLAILDVGVPDGHGFDVCRSMRQMSNLPIVFLTARAEEIDRILGLELGADDYVSKPFSPREVCARVRAILRRSASGGAAAIGHPFAAGALAVAAPPVSVLANGPLLCLDETAQRIAWGGELLALTRYEYLLLAALLRRPGRIFTRAELMSLVWGDAPDTADRTVDAHVKLVRAKLRERGAPADLIQTHRHMGYSIRSI